MILKSFGCSFIFGSELSDDFGHPNYPSHLTWPSLYGKELGYDYRCFARPAAGNLEILDQVLNQTATTDNDLYVIGWTWVDRFSYYNFIPTNSTKFPWGTIMPSDTTEIAKTYYKNLHSEYKDKFTSLSYIKLAIDTLNQKNIPYIMTYIDELLFDQQWNTSPAITELQNYIKPHMTTFDNKSFLEWSRSNNYPITPSWHPLEPAHRAAADYMLSLGIHKV